MTRSDEKRRRVRFPHVVGAVVALAILVPVAASAAFTDVPPSNPFYDEINWMGATGISTGFPDGSYRPTEPVTRQAMSAFMARLYNVQAGLASVKTGANGPDADTDTATWTTVDSTTVTVPSGTTGRILAMFSGEGQCNFGDNIFVLFFVVRPACVARITINGTTASPGEVTVMDSDDGAADPDVAVDIEGFGFQATSANAALPPGTYTVAAQVNTTDVADNDDDTVFGVVEYTLSAQVLLNDASL